MKLYPLLHKRIVKTRRRILRAVRHAYRQHGSVRDAAKALGMPRATFHDYLSGKITP